MLSYGKRITAGDPRDEFKSQDDTLAVGSPTRVSTNDAIRFQGHVTRVHL